MNPSYWLFKSEPDCYSFEDLARDRVSPWEGVRNYLARNYMMSMNVGDLGLFYHSSCEVPAVVGTLEVVRKSYPDPTQFDPNSEYFDPKSTIENPRWHLVDVAAGEPFPKPIPLRVLRETPGLEEMAVAKRGNRLSITPVTEGEWKIVVGLAFGTP